MESARGTGHGTALAQRRPHHAGSHRCDCSCAQRWDNGGGRVDGSFPASPGGGFPQRSQGALARPVRGCCARVGGIRAPQAEPPRHCPRPIRRRRLGHLGGSLEARRLGGRRSGWWIRAAGSSTDRVAPALPCAARRRGVPARWRGCDLRRARPGGRARGRRGLGCALRRTVTPRRATVDGSLPVTR